MLMARGHLSVEVVVQRALRWRVREAVVEVLRRSYDLVEVVGVHHEMGAEEALTIAFVPRKVVVHGARPGPPQAPLAVSEAAPGLGS